MQANILIKSASMVLLMLVAACSTIRSDYAKPHTEALPPAEPTVQADDAAAENVDPAAKYVDSGPASQDGVQSGFRLLTLNSNALMSRVALAERAKQSIDLQYYIFEDDDTGRLIAQSLLKAADRGVRVRMLVDDITKGSGELKLFEALDAHDAIEVRLFNPFNTRAPGILSKTAQMLVEFRRLNRRMHNKAFIVDNRVAIIGGRNIGDDYFDANEKNNYRDLDLLAIGPVVPTASHSFDAYWNNEASVPVSAYHNAKDSPIDLAKARVELDKHVRKFAESDFAQAVIEELPDGATADRRGQWFWGTSVLAADQPEKIELGEDQPNLRIAPAVRRLITGAQSELLLITPYFVPSDQDQRDLITLAKRGVATRILTNSLASTDQVAVHSAYSSRRRALVGGGVELFELKPVAGVTQTAAQLDRTSNVSLHAKSFVVDSRYVFVGSMNMDNRSKLLNTEMGLIVDSPELAKAVAQYFAIVTLPANAYRLGLQGKNGAAGGDGQLIWNTEENGQPKTLTSEPEAGLMKNVKVMLFKLLPIDGLL